MDEAPVETPSPSTMLRELVCMRMSQCATHSTIERWLHCVLDGTWSDREAEAHDERQVAEHSRSFIGIRDRDEIRPSDPLAP